MAVRVITWNVARRVARLVEQAAALASREPDVVALQEVTSRTLPLWRAACATIGLEHVRASLDSADPAREPAARRRTGVLLAARESLGGRRDLLSVPWPETTLSARVELASAAIEVCCVHVPNAANGPVKIHTLDAIRTSLEQVPPAPRVLCGDLNTPRRELPDGRVISFARDSAERLRPDRGPAWDAAELSVVPGLRDLGYRDAFRSLHGYHVDSPSWTWRQIAGHGGGWRIDHLFASAELRPIASTYHHAWRDDGLSDHSALEADLVHSPAGRREAPGRAPLHTPQG